MTEPLLIEAVSNYAFVIKEFLDCIERQFPTIAFVYDENLAYESSVSAFAFRRNVLRWRESGAGRRQQICNTLKPDLENDRTFLYRSISGQLDLEFLFIETVAEEVEKFELIYLSEGLLNRKRLLSVPIPHVGDTPFEYQVEFGPLESKVFNIDSNYYKAVQGTTTFSGSFLLFEGTSPIIKEIVASVRNFNNAVLCPSHTITPEP